MSSLTVQDLGALRRAVAEAARTDASNAKDVSTRFVEITPGVVEQLQAKRHHLLTGRRGSGKSTHLYHVRGILEANTIEALIVDMETFKGLEYPDVLIMILLEILEVIGATQSQGVKGIWRNRKVRKIASALKQLLNSPQTTSNFETNSRDDTHVMSAYSGVQIGRRRFGLGARANRGTKSSSSKIRTAEYDLSKSEMLNGMVAEISSILTELVNRSGSQMAVLFLDDFYFVSKDHQALVLDFLHKICKGTGVWLKIGAVGTRIQPFKDGDPPIGMQPAQDVDVLAIDLSLGEFNTAKRFLENVLEKILAPMKVTVEELFTEKARERMVLACGGAVPRDYLSITEAALGAAIEKRGNRETLSDDNEIRIHSEDVQRAISRKIVGKEASSINQDAGEDAKLLLERWQDVRTFAENEGTMFILVELSRLEGEPWGAEILQLENLRLLHRVGEGIPNTDKWRGRRAAIYMLDLGTVAERRVTGGIIEFWKGTREFDKLRRARFIYDPDKLSGTGLLEV